MATLVWDYRELQMDLLLASNSNCPDAATHAGNDDVFIVLAPTCHLAKHGELDEEDEEQCKVNVHAYPDSDDDVGLENPEDECHAHILTSGEDELDLSIHMKDLIGHMLRIVGRYGDHAAEAARRLAPFVAEALLLQACYFIQLGGPGCVGNATFNPVVEAQEDESHFDISVSCRLCHEYPVDISEYGCRMTTDFSSCLEVFGRGSYVKLTVTYVGCDTAQECQCEHCLTFDQRFADSFLIAFNE